MEARASDARARLPRCSSVWDYRRLAAARLAELQPPLQLLVAIQAVLANSSQQPHRQTTAHAAWPFMAPSKLSARVETAHLGMGMAAARWI